MKYTIYRITSPSDKVYIGQSSNIKKRFEHYKCLLCKGQTLLYRSLKKYGFNSHTIEIIKTDLSFDEANLEEIKWIAYYKQLKISLNLSDGGQFAFKYKSIPILQFDLEGNFIKEWFSGGEVESTIGIRSSLISNAIKEKRYFCHGFLWIKKSDYLKGVVPFWKNKNNTTLSKKVYMYSLDSVLIKEFDSIETCAKFLKCNIKNISYHLNKKFSIYKNHIFSFKKETPEIPKDYKLNKNIVMYSELTREEFYYNSPIECARHLNISYKCINKSLNTGKSYKNYKFKYKQTC